MLQLPNLLALFTLRNPTLLRSLLYIAVTRALSGCCLQSCDGHTRLRLGVACKGILVEENSAILLGVPVEVLRQRPISDDAHPFLHTNHMPRAVEVTRQRARVRALDGPGFQERSCSLSVGRRFF